MATEHECIYCGYECDATDEAPDTDDDEAWASLAAEHDPDCEWVRTRAHRVLANAEEV